MRRPYTPEERTAAFWSRVDRNGPIPPHRPDLGPCWLWTGGGTRYGRFWDGKRHQSVHRVVWEMANGPIPPGLCVCHACDTPKCANPSHLWLGTFADNNRDRATKGRSNRDMSMRRPTRGEMVNTAKLTADIVRLIRRRYAAGGTTHLDLAATYGVHEPAIYKIIHRRTWAHV